MRKGMALLLAALALLLCACGAPGAAEEKSDAEVLLVAPATGDDSLEQLTQAVENALAGQNVRCACTDEAGLSAALERAAADGVRTLAVQPLWLLGGEAYGALYAALAQQAGDFDAVALGTPLLTTEEDFAAAAEALAALAAADGGAAFCFVGGAVGGGDDYAFGLLQQTLRERGCANCFIGAEQAEPTRADVLAAVQAAGYARAELLPLALFADEGAAAAAEDWREALASAGCETVSRAQGLAALEPVRTLLAAHALDALAWAQGAEA